MENEQQKTKRAPDATRSDQVKVRMGVFLPMSLAFVVIIALGLLAPKAFYDAENAIVNFAFQDFGWLFQISGNIFLFICLFFCFSRYGDIRFGGKDAKPEMSTWNWFAISLCAGIATGIVFWGIAEPLYHLMDSGVFETLGITPKSEEAAMFSMVTTYIHWTFIPYAMYAICGLGIAYGAYNMNLPYRVSSTLYPLAGRHIEGPVGTVVDSLCLLAIAGGVAAVLGVGTMQISSGIQIMTGIAAGRAMWVAVVAAIVAVYIISSYTGLNRGIRWLSDKNAKIFLALLVFVFVFGPTRFILSLGTQATGHFIDDFFVRTHYLSPVDGSAWPRWWPIYYWAIWLAYAPLIGMFLARLVKGRTIRQFMFMNLFMPAFFGFLWFSVFGGAAIHLELSGQGLWEAIHEGGKLALEKSVFEFLKFYPLTKVISWIFMGTVFVSIVTMADSMTSTVASLSTTAAHQEGLEPPAAMKIFWGVVMSSVAIINLISGSGGGEISGIDATKQIATVAGFPILFLMMVMAFSICWMIVRHAKGERVLLIRE